MSAYKVPTVASTVASAVKSLAEMPGPPALPLIGSLFTIKFSKTAIEDYHNELLRMRDKYGPIFKEKSPLSSRIAVHIFDPVDARKVFLSDGKQPYIEPLQSTTLEYRRSKGMNPGLGNLNGPEWYRLRSAVQQAMMRPDSVHQYLPFVNQVSLELIEHIQRNLDENHEIDMRVVAGRWSLEAAGLTVFEKRLGALTDRIAWADELVQLNREVFRLSAKMRFRPPFYKYFSTPNWWKMVKLEDQFYREVDALSSEAIEKLTSSNEDNKIRFASKLINKPNLNVVDIKTILLSLFSDGLSTTAPMLIYNLFLLAKNPEHQERAREEVNSVVAAGQELTPDLLNRLPYLRACMKETFRLLTITPEISRIPQVDLVLGGYLVPAQTPVDIHTSLVQNRAYFNNPSEFRPSRWLRDCPHKEEGPPFLQTPFGHGPRMCAGRRFAEQDLLVVLARLIQHFRIEHRHEPIRQVYETLLLPDGDCRFHFTPVH